MSFKEGGVDVPFIADPNQYDGRYWIATEVEGTKDLKKIADLPDKSILYKGTRYKLVSGADAILLMDWEGWKRVVETRKVTEGRRSRRQVILGKEIRVTPSAHRGKNAFLNNPFFPAALSQTKASRNPPADIGSRTLSKTSKALRIALWRVKRAARE